MLRTKGAVVLLYVALCSIIYFHTLLDTVFQGQYLPSLSINYVAINKEVVMLQHFTPLWCVPFAFRVRSLY